MLLEIKTLYNNTVIFNTDNIATITDTQSGLLKSCTITMTTGRTYTVDGTAKELKNKIENSSNGTISISSTPEFRNIISGSAEWHEYCFKGAMAYWSREPKPKTHAEAVQKIIDEAIRIAELKAPYDWIVRSRNGYNDKSLLMKCLGELSEDLVHETTYEYHANRLWELDNNDFEKVDLKDIIPGDIVIYSAPKPCASFSAIYIGDSHVVECSGWNKKVVNVVDVFKYKVQGVLRLKTERFLEKDDECSYETRGYAY